MLLLAGFSGLPSSGVSLRPHRQRGGRSRSADPVFAFSGSVVYVCRCWLAAAAAAVNADVLPLFAVLHRLLADSACTELLPACCVDW